MNIQRVAVIGAGVMGAGIAAQVANAGVPVLLLDIPATEGPDKSKIAKNAIARMAKTDPQPLMHARNAKRITPGNLEDDFQALSECDWIIEAVIERIDIKRDLYKRIAAVKKPGAAVSSNTSTIPLEKLTDGMPADLRSAFLITHFFNPPRYMRLLEVVVSAHTDESISAAIREFADMRLGKGIVECKDTPGFIANRIGTFWLQVGVMKAIEMDVGVEEADAIIGKPLGIPKTGVFGLLDLVGIDLMPHILASMRDNLDPSDAFFGYADIPPVITGMLQKGYSGRKGKGGFYRLNRTADGKVKEVIDLSSGNYHAAQRPKPPCVAAAAAGGMRELVSQDDPGSRYAWQVVSHVLEYAAGLLPEISDHVCAVDEAMRLGYHWKYGPFELIDKLGAKWFADALEADGRTVPKLLLEAAEREGFYKIQNESLNYLSLSGDYVPVPRAADVLLLADIKLRSQPVVSNHAASLWDIGDGVACLEFHTRMNALEPDTLDLIGQSLKIVGKQFKGMVIYNEASNFCVGANLGLALFAANIAGWPMIEGMVRLGQQTMKAMKYAPFPVVGAPSGMALGGGCEILLHCDAIEAHAESYIGLVEVGVGLIPGWGGCKELLLRWDEDSKRPRGPMPPVIKAFETISTATVAKSAEQAKQLRFLRQSDAIVMNRNRLLASAKAKALALAEDYSPPQAREISLPGASAKAAMQLAVQGFRMRGLATAYDVVVADALSNVLSGGDTDITETTSEDQLFSIERTEFMSLVRSKGTLQRVEHMLETGKPLRN